MILRHTYTRSRDVARAGLRYYQMRPRGEGEPPRSLFGKDGVMSREEAYRLLDEHQVGSGAGGQRGYLAHRLMLSPEEGERPEDLRAMTYRVMRGLEREQGRELAWVAVEHRNTAHPHVHIVLAGGGEAPGGRVAEVRIYRADHDRIKADARDYCSAEARVRDGFDRALAAAARDDEGARVPARGADRDDDWSP